MCSLARIDAPVIGLEEIRRRLETGSLNSIRSHVSDERIEKALAAAGIRFRKRLLTPKVTTLHMILAGLYPEESFAASWDVLWDFMTSRLPEAAGKSPKSGSLSKARGRLSETFWKTLFGLLAEEAQRLSAPLDAWCGHRVVLLDGTCVSMGDDPGLRQAFGVPKGCHGKARYPLARVVAAALAQTKTIIAYAVDRYRTGENELAARLLGSLRRGDLIVADRGFAGVARYAKYLASGFEFVTRMHQCQHVGKLPRLIEYSRNDFVTDLAMPGAYRRRDPSLPEKVRVRIIRRVIEGREGHEVLWLVTSLLDAKTYPAAQIARVYGRRWRIEELIEEVKVKASADVLRSRTPAGVRKELAARVIAVNVVRMIALEAAQAHGVDPLRISFVRTVRAILWFAPSLAMSPAWKLLDIYRAMLTEIASHLVPYRPGRNEPRAVRREKKHYPALKETRREWRKAHAA